MLAAALSPILGAAVPASIESPISNAAVSAKAGETIPDSYIVFLREGISHERFESHQRWAQTKHESRSSRRDDSNLVGIHQGFDLSGLYGYTGTFDNSTLEEIKQSEDVDLIEEDKIVIAYDMMVQSNPPSWGLSRISALSSTGNGCYTYASSAGKGVNVYVLDTGTSFCIPPSPPCCCIPL